MKVEARKAGRNPGAPQARSLTAALALLLPLACPVTAISAERNPYPPLPFWVGVSLGARSMLSRPDPMQQAGSGRSGFAYGVEGGIRLRRHWLLGVGGDAGRLGSYPCREAIFCDSIRQEFHNVYLLAGLNPDGGPWTFQVGAGPATYEMTDDDDYAFADSMGYAWKASVGYSFHPAGSRLHFGLRASYVQADPGDFGGNGDADGLGSAAYKAVLLGFTLAWR